MLYTRSVKRQGKNFEIFSVFWKFFEKNFLSFENFGKKFSVFWKFQKKFFYLLKILQKNFLLIFMEKVQKNIFLDFVPTTWEKFFMKFPTNVRSFKPNARGLAPKVRKNFLSLAPSCENFFLFRAKGAKKFS